jgi:hypothetical protein
MSVPNIFTSPPGVRLTQIVVSLIKYRPIDRLLNFNSAGFCGHAKEASPSVCSADDGGKL